MAQAQPPAQTRPFRVLVGTPCGGGLNTTQFTISIMAVQQRVMLMKHQIFLRNNLRMAKEMGQINEQNLQALNQLEAMQLIDMDVGFYALTSESLLSRGRNHIAATAIRQGWDKLFFIDSDAKFTVDQFMAIATAPHDLCAGVCPVKVLPIHLNYLPFQADEHYYEDRIRSVDSLLKMREGHKSRYLSIAYVGTAFMAITRKLLLAAAADSEEYMYPNPATGLLITHWNMFDTRAMHRKFMSEDWSFCERARALGYKTMIDSDVIISHVGSWVFSPDQAQITHKNEVDSGSPAELKPAQAT